MKEFDHKNFGPKFALIGPANLCWNKFWDWTKTDDFKKAMTDLGQQPDFWEGRRDSLGTRYLDQDSSEPWTVAMVATIFTGWIYDHLKPHAAAAKVAHPLMLRAIAAAKKKNDTIDAGKIADCLRCDFLPECYMAATEIRERRRTLRYRHLLVRQMVQMKSRVSGLLTETGVSHNKQRLHKVGYFPELLANADAVSTSIQIGRAHV